MNTISFFSFKGGVGRTQALLNTAYLLAEMGYFVVMADMDIHAPGLTLMPELGPAKPGDKKGEGLLGFLEEVLIPSDSDTITALTALVYRPRLVQIAEKKRGALTGDLMFLPCGNLGSDIETTHYHERLRRLPLNKLNRLKPSGKNVLLLTEIQDQLKNLQSEKLGGRKPDFLFIDARTGFTEISDMIISRNSDHVVMVCGLNEQNRRGLDLILSQLMTEFEIPVNNLPSGMSVVIGPVPDGEEALKEKRFGQFKELLEKRARFDESRNTKETLPDLFTVPYHPMLALSEDVISLHHPLSAPVESYKKIAEHLKKYMVGIHTLESAIGQQTRGRVSEIIPPETEKKPLQSYKKHIHPLSVTIPWNALCPKKSWKELISQPPKEIEFDFQVFFSLLASSISLSMDEKTKMIKTLHQLSQVQLTELLQIFQEERNNFLGYPANNWLQLVELLGKHQGEWLALLDELGVIDGKGTVFSQLTGEGPFDVFGPAGEYPQFWMAVSKTLEGKYYHSSALMFLEVSLEKFPETGDIHQELGDLYLRTHRLAESEKAY
ncbi:MAG: ParA family protein, partial [bacterium]|nr:ParA family protein [bacterium]